jgi:hypothetical protein
MPDRRVTKEMTEHLEQFTKKPVVTDSKVDSILGNRGPIYGDYTDQIELRNSLMMLMAEAHYAHSGKVLGPAEHQYLWDILNKLTRVAATPNHLDTWQDIAGYATLIVKSINKRGVGVDHAHK